MTTVSRGATRVEFKFRHARTSPFCGVWSNALYMGFHHFPHFRWLMFEVYVFGCLPTRKQGFNATDARYPRPCSPYYRVLADFGNT